MKLYNYKKSFLQHLGHAGSFTVVHRLSCSVEFENLHYLTRDWTHVPCLARIFFFNVSGMQQGDSVIHIHIYYFSYTRMIFQIIFHYRLLQDIDYSSRCYTVKQGRFLATGPPGKFLRAPSFWGTLLNYLNCVSDALQETELRLMKTDLQKRKVT